MTIAGLKTLADFGFNASFTRAISYAMGGASNIYAPHSDTDTEQIRNAEPNWGMISDIVSTMRAIYWRIGFAFLVIMAVAGSLFLARFVSETGKPELAWIAWGILLFVTTANIWGAPYSAYLSGTNHIAPLRRGEALIGLAGILSSVSVLAVGGGLLELILASQLWVVLTVIRNRWLCRHLEEGQFATFTNNHIDPLVFRDLWPSAWRSGLGVLLSTGITQISALAYAHFGTTTETASYLLSLRFITSINQFSQAPFYSKIPLLARLYSEGRQEELISIARRGMRLAYWAYVIGFIGVGTLSGPLLSFIHSKVPFASPPLWTLLGLAFFVERYGAMHIQLYSTTNHIVWHITNGISGIITLIIMFVAFHFIGVYAFPLSILCGNLSFYSWYSASLSYGAFKIHFLNFEKNTLLPPFAILVFFMIYMLVW